MNISFIFFFIIYYIMTFDIIELNPTVETLKELAIKYQWLSINGILDKEWYEAVKKARIELKSTRVEITKKGKELRDDANKFAKYYKMAVIEKEKELIWYIEPMERDLEAKQKEIDELKEIEKRKEQLYSRRQRLSEIWVELQDDDILRFDDQQFYDFIQDQKAENLRLEQEKLEAEKKAFEEERLKAEREKEIEKAKKEAEEKKQAEENEKAKKNESYKKWLLDNNFNDTKDRIERDGQKFTMYKFISEIIL